MVIDFVPKQILHFCGKLSSSFLISYSYALNNMFQSFKSCDVKITVLTFLVRIVFYLAASHSSFSSDVIWFLSITPELL